METPELIKPKTLSINNDVWMMVKNKQTEFMNKTKKYYNMTDIADMAVRHGIRNLTLDEDNKISHVVDF